MLLRRRYINFKTVFALILILITSTFLYFSNFCNTTMNLKDLEVILQVRNDQLNSKIGENEKLKSLTKEQEKQIKKLQDQLTIAENFGASKGKISGKFSARVGDGNAVSNSNDGQNEKLALGDSNSPRASSGHKLAVIVPFRDRFDELLVFVPHMTKFLNNQLGGENYKILIVNQADMYRFNRASLINIGYFLAIENGCDYMVMHDVDLLPNNPGLNYEFPKGAEAGTAAAERKIAGAEELEVVDKSVYHLSSPEYHPKYHYSKYIGGVLLMTTQVFELLNGLSNNYWGWGREDDELYTRMDKHGINVKRTSGLTTGYDTYIHIHDDLDERRKRDYHRSTDQKEAQWVADKYGGYKTLKYNLKSRQEINLNTLDDGFHLGKCDIYNIELECDFEVTPWCVTDDKIKKAIEMQKIQKERIDKGGPVNWVYKGNDKVKVVKGST